ncbi:MAG: hypothetical protein ACOC95_09775 [Planctomycetota bacterium]
MSKSSLTLGRIPALVGWLGPRILPSATANTLRDGHIIPAPAGEVEHAVGLVQDLWLAAKSET